MLECSYLVEGENQEFILSGKLDQSNFSDFEEYIKEKYKSNFNVVIDLQTLSYISSVGLRSFIVLAKLVHGDKKNIFVRAKDGSMVKQLIELSGFTKLMPFLS